MSHGRNPILVKIFAVVGIAIVAACTWFTLLLIYDLWYPPFFNKVEKPLAPSFVKMATLAKGIQPDNFTIAYRTPEYAASVNSFHDIPVPKNMDKVSLCMTCHGLLPHNSNIDTRAFRNKHSSDIACETCHIEGEGKPAFKWYNIKDGRLVNSIKIEGPLINPDYKIIITYGIEKNIAYNKTAEIKQAVALLDNAENLTAAQRREQIKPFHKGLRPDGTAVKCESCHNPSGSSFLPYESLGYPKGRVQVLLNSEVVGMIQKYKEFYIPSFLNTNSIGVRQ